MLTKAGHGVEDLVGGFGPNEGFRVLVVVGDEVWDFVLAILSSHSNHADARLPIEEVSSGDSLPPKFSSTKL